MGNKSLLKNFGSYGLGSVITLIIGFLTSPIITRIIDPVEYGKFSMFTMFTSIVLIIIICGLDQSFVRFFYEEKEIARGKLLLYSLKIPLLLNLIFSVVLIIFYNNISMYLFEIHSIGLIILIILNNTVMLFNRYAILIIRMQQKGKLFSILQIIQKVAYVVFILILLIPLNKDIKVLVYSSIISNLIITFLAIWNEKTFWKNMRADNITLKNSEIEMIKYGIPLVFTSLITWLFQSADRVAIKKYLGYDELGVYGAAFTIIALLNAIQATFTTFWTPVAYEKYERDSSDKNFFVQINRIVTISMFYVGVLLILFKDLIVYLLGEKYREASFIMPFLIFMPLMYTISETTVLGINFKKKPKFHIWIALVSCIINIVGNSILVPLVGAKGAAISTGIAYIVFFTMRTLISKRLYYINYGLVKFYICVAFMSLFAIYSSFNRFNLIILTMGLFNIILITFLYLDIIVYLYRKLKKS